MIESDKFNEIMKDKNSPPWDELSLDGLDDSDPDVIAVLELKAIFSGISKYKTNAIRLYEIICTEVDQGTSFIDRLNSCEDGRKFLFWFERSRQNSRDTVFGSSDGIKANSFKRRTSEQIAKQQESEFKKVLFDELNELWKNPELKELWRLYKQSKITKDKLLIGIIQSKESR